MDSIHSESRVQRTDAVPWKQLDDTVVVLDLITGDFFELDEIGARIWLALDGTRSLRELAADLAREYEASADQIRSDVIAFVADLHTRALIAIV